MCGGGCRGGEPNGLMSRLGLGLHARGRCGHAERLP